MRQMEVARTYVQDLGGGLIMLGGDQSFGLGGYYKTALEEILPVRSDFEKEKEKPSLAMMLVIDKSGSMGGEKIEMAKEAAKSGRRAARAQRQGRRASPSRGRTSGSARSTPAPTRGSSSTGSPRIEAGGGTVMYPAMEEAYEALQRTVGQAQARDHPDRRHLRARRLRGDRPGDGRRPDHGLDRRRSASDADQNLLEEIARIGNGRYYFADDPAHGPADLRQGDRHGQQVGDQRAAVHARRSSGRPRSLSEIDVDAAPFLLGYVVTRPKPTSEVILATEAGDPLLAWWRYGLGMSVAFTSDAKARWAAEWLAWPQFGKFWAQVVRHAMRKAEAKGVVVAGRSARTARPSSRSTRSTRPAGSSTAPRPS